MSARSEQKELALRELRTIPGVGKSISQDLWELGMRSAADLKGQDPQLLYEKSCAFRGMPVDRCLLYVFRCAVYYASHKNHQPEKLFWWNWKDKR